MSTAQIAITDVIAAFKSVGVEFEMIAGGSWTVLIDGGREGSGGFKTFQEALLYALERLRREA